MYAALSEFTKQHEAVSELFFPMFETSVFGAETIYTSDISANPACE